MARRRFLRRHRRWRMSLMVALVVSGVGWLLYIHMVTEDSAQASRSPAPLVAP
ncbi:MAG: hypothetical protein AB7N91_07895 [Candidatus Tectimicrobiota bacterium]